MISILSTVLHPELMMRLVVVCIPTYVVYYDFTLTLLFSFLNVMMTVMDINRTSVDDGAQTFLV